MNIVSSNTQTRGERFAVAPLVYVNFPNESAFILNLSDKGMAIQTMDILEPGRRYQFSFPLPDSDSEVQGDARIAWSDRSGRAGLEFVDLPPVDRLKLSQWTARMRDSKYAAPPRLM
jgi:hypothetical protein